MAKNSWNYFRVKRPFGDILIFSSQFYVSIFVGSWIDQGTIYIFFNKLFFISKFWAKIRPTSTEHDPETSAAESDIENLQFRYRRLKYKIKACMQNSRKQDNVIKQLKLETEQKNEKMKKQKLENEKLKSEKLENEEKRKDEIRSTNRKFNILLCVLPIFSWQLYSGYENKIELQSCDHKNKKFKNELQEKQNELKESEHRFIQQQTENRRLVSENRKYKSDLQEKIQATEEQYNTYIKRELLSWSNFN